MITHHVASLLSFSRAQVRLHHTALCAAAAAAALLVKLLIRIVGAPAADHALDRVHRLPTGRPTVPYRRLAVTPHYRKS